jgi:hypothetical protein
MAFPLPSSMQNKKTDIMANDTNKQNTGNTGADQKNTQRQANPTGQQPGIKREGAENTQMGNDRQPGTQRQGAETTQMRNAPQAPTDAKGAQNTQAGPGNRSDDARGSAGSGKGASTAKSAPARSTDDEEGSELMDTETEEVEGTGTDNTDPSDEANAGSGARK